MAKKRGEKQHCTGVLQKAQTYEKQQSLQKTQIVGRLSYSLKRGEWWAATLNILRIAKIR